MPSGMNCHSDWAKLMSSSFPVFGATTFSRPHGNSSLIQSIGAGTDQFDRGLLRERGVRLASAQGVNERAVSQHAMALILAMARRLPEARDNQARSFLARHDLGPCTDERTS